MFKTTDFQPFLVMEGAMWSLAVSGLHACHPAVWTYSVKELCLVMQAVETGAQSLNFWTG